MIILPKGIFLMQTSQDHLWSSDSLCSQEKIEGGVVDATLLSGGVMRQRLWLLIFLRPLVCRSQKGSWTLLGCRLICILKKWGRVWNVTGTSIVSYFPTVNSFRLKCRGKDLEKRKAREPWKNGSKTDFYLGKNSESPECMYIQKQAYIHSSLC